MNRPLSRRSVIKLLGVAAATAAAGFSYATPARAASSDYLESNYGVITHSDYRPVLEEPRVNGIGLAERGGAIAVGSNNGFWIAVVNNYTTNPYLAEGVDWQTYAIWSGIDLYGGLGSMFNVQSTYTTTTWGSEVLIYHDKWMPMALFPLPDGSITSIVGSGGAEGAFEDFIMNCEVPAKASPRLDLVRTQMLPGGGYDGTGLRFMPPNPEMVFAYTDFSGSAIVRYQDIDRTCRVSFEFYGGESTFTLSDFCNSFDAKDHEKDGFELHKLDNLGQEVHAYITTDTATQQISGGEVAYACTVVENSYGDFPCFITVTNNTTPFDAERFALPFFESIRSA